MTYAVAIKLVADNFKKGISTVRGGLSSLQANIVTLASAIGALDVSLSGFVSGVVNVTRETSRAATLMKNTSATTADYAANMRWAADVAKRYGTYVNDVVRGFAKFQGAANGAGMALDEQRELFENVSRACAAFALSADETNGVFVALTQMIGKGKIQAEELRGQLGERMPIAMQAMAKAAGTTVAGLDALMKQGKLTADILPEFGRALAGMVPEIDTDTVEGAFNDLRNAAKEFTDTLDLGGVLKRGAQGLASGIRTVADNIGNVVVAVIALITASVARGATKIWQNFAATSKSIQANARATEQQLTDATARRVAAEKRLEATRLAMAKANSVQRLRLEAKEVEQKNTLDKARTAEAAAQSAARQAQQLAEATSATTAWGRVRSTIIMGAARIKTALQSMWAAWGPAIIIGAITSIIGYFVNLKREIGEINKRLDDFKAKLKTAGKDTAQQVEVRGYADIARDTDRDEATRLDAARLVARRTGQSGQGTNEKADAFIERVLSGVDTWEQQQEVKGRREAANSGKSEALQQVNAARAEVGLAALTGQEDSMELSSANVEYQNALRQQANRSQKLGSSELQKASVSYSTNIDIIIEANRALANTEDIAVLADTEQQEGGTTVTGGGDSGNDTDGSDKMKSAREKYAAEVNRIAAEYEVGAKTASEAAQAVDELRMSTLVAIAANEEATEADRAFADDLASRAPMYTEQMQKTDALNEIMTDYTRELDTAAKYRADGLITEKEYYDMIAAAAEQAAKQASAMGGATEAVQKFKQDMDNARNNIKEIEKDEAEATATTPEIRFDDDTRGTLGKLEHGKEFMDAYSNLQKIQDTIDELNAKGITIGEDLSCQLEKAKSKVEDLGKALKIDALKEGIDGMMSGMNSMVGGIDGVVSAFENIGEMMNDEDATGWDKFKAGFQVFMSIYQAIKTTMGAIQAFQQAMQMLGIVTKTSAMTGAAGEVAASQAVTTAKTAETAANTGAAVSGVFSAHSAIPFIGVAIAAAMVGAMLAMILSSKRKAKNYAMGGIVQGATATGDQIAANLNAGEMVLNRRQQRNLWALLDGGGTGRSRQSAGTTVRLRGEDLYVSIDNYQGRTGKRWR